MATPSAEHLLADLPCTPRLTDGLRGILSCGWTSRDPAAIDTVRMIISLLILRGFDLRDILAPKWSVCGHLIEWLLHSGRRALAVLHLGELVFLFVTGR